MPEAAAEDDGRRRWPQKPFGKWLVTASFTRGRSGKGKSLGKTACARRRRSRPGVGCGWRSHEPVGTAGPVAAAYVRTAPARSASSGKRWQVSCSWTNWRAAPSICLAANGSCSTGQRSRYSSRRACGARSSGVATNSGPVEAGWKIATTLKVGLPGAASGYTSLVHCSARSCTSPSRQSSTASGRVAA